MVSINKYLLFSIFFFVSAFADHKKVYFYTTEKSINDFKSLKVSFENYIKKFGHYEFQAFSDKYAFETYVKKENVIVILSSWHLQQISKKHQLHAKLVALRKKSRTGTKVLVGKKGSVFNGVVTTAFSKEYTHQLMDELSAHKNIKQLGVPKEIDALMSVAFGMSKFALVSKDSLELIQKNNAFLASQIHVYKESLPDFRIVVAFKSDDKQNQKLIKMFAEMSEYDDGQKVLDLLNVDGLVTLTQNELRLLGGVK